MPLITCSDCGKEQSDLAAACPNCGCPTQVTKDHAEEQERRDRERWAKESARVVAAYNATLAAETATHAPSPIMRRVERQTKEVSDTAKYFVAIFGLAALAFWLLGIFPTEAPQKEAEAMLTDSASHAPLPSATSYTPPPPSSSGETATSPSGDPAVTDEYIRKYKTCMAQKNQATRGADRTMGAALQAATDCDKP